MEHPNIHDHESGGQTQELLCINLNPPKDDQPQKKKTTKLEYSLSRRTFFQQPLAQRSLVRIMLTLARCAW